MRLNHVVVFAVTYLLAAAVDSLADPITIRDAGKRRFELAANESLSDTIALHGHAPVSLSLEATDPPGHGHHFSSRLQPELPDGSLAHAAVPRHKGGVDKPKRERKPCGGDCPTPVPEPASAMLLAFGMGVTGVVRWCRRQSARRSAQAA